MPNPTEIDTFWTVVGKGAAIIGVIVAIVQGVRYLYSLMPSSKLEKRLKQAETNLERDYEHLKKHDDDIELLNKKTDDTAKKIDQVNQGVHRLGKSQIALLNHQINGNGIDKLKEEADDLTDFFIDR